MASFIGATFSFVIIIILVIVSVLTGVAAREITLVSGYKNDPDLSEAHSKLTIATITGWIGVIVVALILAYYLTREKPSPTYLRLFLFIGLTIAFIIGILASIASTDMDKSSSDKIKNTDARSNSNIAAIFGVTGGVIGIVGVIYSFIRGRKKTKGTEKTKEAKKEKSKKE